MFVTWARRYPLGRHPLDRARRRRPALPETDGQDRLGGRQSPVAYLLLRHLERMTLRMVSSSVLVVAGAFLVSVFG
jgi:hypothetical protein